MGDLISREQAIAEMHLAFGAKPAVHARAVAILKSLPSEEKTGRWLSGDMSGLLLCSACGEFLDEFGHRWNYCPNCGAKMDAEEGEPHEQN